MKGFSHLGVEFVRMLSMVEDFMCRRALLGLTLWMLTAVMFSQSVGASSPAPRSGSQQAAAAQGAKPEDPEMAAMRSDLQRMRVLVNQMQMNLAFVQTTNTPLKHEFELEIEMWQILVGQMERRFSDMAGKAGGRGKQ
jgi:hypothetical protein